MRGVFHINPYRLFFTDQHSGVCGDRRNRTYISPSKVCKEDFASGKRTIWNKGKPTPYAANNGKKSADKLRQTALGRRKHILPDGSWTWKYPETDEGPKPLSD